MRNVAIVGFGFMGKMHYGAWGKARGARVSAICDANLAQLTSRMGGNRGDANATIAIPKRVRIYESFDALLAAGGFDTVDITLPTPLHAEMSVRALLAGYDVFCEKPMALSVADCDRMLAAAKKSGKLLFVGQCLRFSPEYEILKSYVESGKYGRVVAADFTRFCPAPGWNNGGKSWFLDEKKSGGAAIDMHVHDADFIQYLFGLPPSVMTHTHVRADGLTDHLSTVYGYADKLVTADTSWAAAGSLVFDAAYRVFFERATVYCGERYRDAVMVYPAAGKPFAPKLAKGSCYEREIQYFCNLLNGKRPAKEVLTARDARNAIALVCAECKSAKTGRTVRV